MRLRRLVAALATAAFALSACSHAPAVPPIVAIGKPAPEIALTDQDGAPFALSNLRGNVAIVFFGYAHCEDVCPATLAHIHLALERLPADARARVKVAFVTVDPFRDTPAAMKAYVANFDPSFYGLTGSFAALRPVYRAYRVFHGIVPRNLGKPYLVAHEGAIYIVDRAGIVRDVRDWRDTPDAIAANLRPIV